MAVKRTKKSVDSEVVVNNDFEVKAEVEEETPVDVVENMIEEPVDDGIVADPSLVEDSEETTDKKNVRVRLKKKYHCHVGGKFYEFNEGVCYNVPENVKMVLTKADVLDVL